MVSPFARRRLPVAETPLAPPLKGCATRSATYRPWTSADRRLLLQGHLEFESERPDSVADAPAQFSFGHSVSYCHVSNLVFSVAPACPARSGFSRTIPGNSLCRRRIFRCAHKAPEASDCARVHTPMKVSSTPASRRKLRPRLHSTAGSKFFRVVRPLPMKRSAGATSSGFLPGYSLTQPKPSAVASKPQALTSGRWVPATSCELDRLKNRTASLASSGFSGSVQSWGVV